jgi:hypothetical protein
MTIPHPSDRGFRTKRKPLISSGATLDRTARR